MKKAVYKNYRVRLLEIWENHEQNSDSFFDNICDLHNEFAESQGIINYEKIRQFLKDLQINPKYNIFNFDNGSQYDLEDIIEKALNHFAPNKGMISDSDVNFKIELLNQKELPCLWKLIELSKWMRSRLPLQETSDNWVSAEAVNDRDNVFNKVMKFYKGSKLIHTSEPFHPQGHCQIMFEGEMYFYKGYGKDVYKFVQSPSKPKDIQK